jgi:hypothetical protein
MHPLNFRFLFFFCSLWSFASLDAVAQTDLFDNSRVHEIRLTTAQANWRELLDSLRLYGDGALEGTAVIDGKTYNNVGISYRSGTSYQINAERNPFHIQLNYKSANQNHQGLKSVKLSSALRDPSMVREVLGFEIANRYMVAPRASYVTLYVNDDYRGVYANVEAIDDVFLSNRYAEVNGAFFKCTPDLRSTAPTGCMQKNFGNLRFEASTTCYEHNFKRLSGPETTAQLVELSNILTERKDLVGSVLNVDQTLRMLAFNNVFVNLSSYTGQYSHNYYLYKDVSGRFCPIIWDMNLGFGSFKNTGEAITASVASDLDLKGLQNMSPLLHANNPDKPLISTLLTNEDFKRLYLSHVRQMTYELVLSSYIDTRARELQKLIRPYMSNDKYKTYSIEEFNNSLDKTVGSKSKIPGILELMVARGKFLKKHPALTPLPPVIDSVDFAKRERFSNIPMETYTIAVKVDRFPKRVFVYWRSSQDRFFQVVELNDNGVNGDTLANDKIFGLTLPAPAGTAEIEYYILAENAALVTFEPGNYIKQLRRISLAELN